MKNEVKRRLFGFWGTAAELIRIALRAILANKMRSFLTVLGIIIGVLAVVAVVSIMQGVFQSILGDFEALGGDTMFIRPNWEMFQERIEGIRRLQLTYEDAQALARDVPQAKEVCPFVLHSDSIAYHGRHDSSQVVGTMESYSGMYSFYPELGRFLAPMDVAARRKVCVIGQDILDKLALPTQCLGTEIQIGRGSYLIVGVLEKKGARFGQSQDDQVFIPLTTAIVQYGPETARNIFIGVQVHDAARMDQAVERISNVLRREHGLRAGATDDFRIFTSEELQRQIKKFTSISTLIVAAIVSITLVVGGIGIMNIMLVSVTERTREIGIRMAVGARRRHILYQFLIESVTLSTLGGVLGLGCGAGLAHLVVWLLRSTVAETFPPAYIPIWVILSSLAFAAFTGAIFGVYPAMKASRLDPIDALRYE
ncbi:MAG: ABC transporter permease [Acidobacteriota bacterium]